MGIVTGYLAQLVNNGIKLLNGGAAVSSSNPLPILSQPVPRNNQQESVFKGRSFKLWVTIAATPSKYAAVQIFNPASSGKAIYVVGISASNSTGTMKWYPLVNNTPLATLSGFSRNLKSDGASPSFELRTEALTTRTANDSFGTNIGSTAPQGATLNTTGEFYLIMPGDGLRYEVETQNIGATLYSTVFEIPLSEMP